MHKSQGPQELISKLSMEMKMVSLGETEFKFIYNIFTNERDYKCEVLGLN